MPENMQTIGLLGSVVIGIGSLIKMFDYRAAVKRTDQSLSELKKVVVFREEFNQFEKRNDEGHEYIKTGISDIKEMLKKQ